MNLFKKLIYLNWRLITLQYCGGFSHTLTWISHGCIWIPHPEPSSTSLPIPSLWVVPVHWLWVPCFMHQTGDWSSISHMAMYMFQCCSLKSSHPHLLPQSPKVCSLHLCLICYLAYRVIVTIFLNSIYMHEYTVLMLFFLTYFTPHNRLRFHPPHWNWLKRALFLLCSRVIVHCIHVPQLSYPFVCRWTSRLLPRPSYCKQCCDEHWRTRQFPLNSGFLSVYVQQWDFWVIRRFCFQFFKDSPHCSPYWLY